ncbi:MAG: ATP-grasp domain-containing protein [Halanaerobiales bacterium]|nr:ATP-grasp domain-containing protein [Halanaerobiales bacterium]
MIAVQRTRDKYLTRVTLDQAGLPNIRYNKCRGIIEVKKYIDDEEQRPMIVKPLDMVGSVGVFKVKTSKDLNIVEKYYKSHRFLQNKQELLVEEYIAGTEISVEGFVNQGAFIPFCITDKFTTGEPYFVEIGHRLPSIHMSYPEGKIEEISINNDLKELEEIISIQFNKKAGDILECFPHRLERIGQILYIGKSYDQMEYIRNLIKEKIEIKIS